MLVDAIQNANIRPRACILHFGARQNICRRREENPHTWNGDSLTGQKMKLFAWGKKHLCQPDNGDIQYMLFAYKFWQFRSTL